MKQKQKKTETTKNGFAVFNHRCNTSDDSYAHQQSCNTHLNSSNKSAHVFLFPLGFLTLWSMVLDQLGSACNFSGSHVDSRSVCQILPGAPHHDLWELRWIGYMEYWKCAMPVCSRGALQQLTVLAQNRENHGKNIWCFPQIFPHLVQFFSRCLRFPMFFTTFSPAFHPFFHRCSPTFPHEIHHFRRGEAGVKLPQLRDGFMAAFQATRQDLVNAACSERIRKARNLWCGTFWIIGHDWSPEVWMDSIQVVWYESTFWIDMTSLEHI